MEVRAGTARASSTVSEERLWHWASASTCRAHSLALSERGLHAQGRSAPGFFLGGKAVVLTGAFQAQLSEGMLLRGATSAGWCCWHVTLSCFSQGAPGGRNSGHAPESEAANNFPPPRRSAAQGEAGPTARALRPHKAGRSQSPEGFSLRTRLSPDFVFPGARCCCEFRAPLSRTSSRPMLPKSLTP